MSDYQSVPLIEPVLATDVIGGVHYPVSGIGRPCEATITSHQSSFRPTGRFLGWATVGGETAAMIELESGHVAVVCLKQELREVMFRFTDRSKPE